MLLYIYDVKAFHYSGTRYFHNPLKSWNYKFTRHIKFGSLIHNAVAGPWFCLFNNMHIRKWIIKIDFKLIQLNILVYLHFNFVLLSM